MIRSGWDQGAVGLASGHAAGLPWGLPWVFPWVFPSVLPQVLPQVLPWGLPWTFAAAGLVVGYHGKHTEIPAGTTVAAPWPVATHGPRRTTCRGMKSQTIYVRVPSANHGKPQGKARQVMEVPWQAPRHVMASPEASSAARSVARPAGSPMENLTVYHGKPHGMPLKAPRHATASTMDASKLKIMCIRVPSACRGACHGMARGSCMAYRGDCPGVAVALAEGDRRGSRAVDFHGKRHRLPRQGHSNPRQGPWQAPRQAAASSTAKGKQVK